MVAGRFDSSSGLNNLNNTIMQYTTKDGFVWNLVTKGQAIVMFRNNEQVFKIHPDESETLIEDELDFADDFVMYGVEGEQPPRKWARVDSKTGKGMNEGYVVNDGDAYFENEADLIEYLRNQSDDKGEGLSDEFILNESFDADEYYYTEWDVEDEMYYYIEQPDGTMKEVENNNL